MRHTTKVLAGLAAAGLWAATAAAQGAQRSAPPTDDVVFMRR